MKVRIEIDTRTFVRFWLVVIAFAIGILAIWVARGALMTLAVALFLALALNPPVSQLARLLPGKSRVGATAIAYLIVVGLLGGFLVMVVPPVIEQSSKFAQSIPGLIDEANSKRGVVDDFLGRYNLRDQTDRAIESAKQQASSVSQNLGNSLVGGVGAVFSGAITLIFILVLTFLMLVEGPQWLDRLWGLYEDPDRLERHRAMVTRMYHVVTGYVNGQIFVAGIAASGALVAVLLLSLVFHLSPNIALPIAAIVFLCGMIPMVGATISSVIVTIVLLFNSVSAALIFLVYFIIYQQIENNFIAPTVQSRTVELTALSILSSIVIGISLFGLIGGIIAIPVAGCLRVLLIHYLDYAKRERQEKRTPLKKLAAKLKNAE